MSVNKVILVGNLGADPEIRQTQGGPVCNLRIATTEKWSDREGNRQERTEWHRVTVWGRMAENCGRFLSKGRQVYVEGRLQSREWQDKDGNNRRSWDVVAQNVQFLSGGQGGQRGGGGGGGGWGQSGGGGGGGNSGGGGGWGSGGGNSGGGGWGQSGGGNGGGGGGWGQSGGGNSGGGGWGQSGGGNKSGGGGGGGAPDDDPIPF